MDDLYNASKIAFASEFSFALKAQNFHWNCEGPLFLQYHQLFEMIYDEAYGSIDTFAENLRKLGTYTPASLSRFNMLTQVTDETDTLPVAEMVSELLTDSDKMVKILKMVYDIAETYNEHGYSNFLAERMDAHRKHSWMLRASSKGQ